MNLEVSSPMPTLPEPLDAQLKEQSSLLSFYLDLGIGITIIWLQMEKCFNIKTMPPRRSNLV